MPCPLHLQYLTVFSFIPDVSPPLPPPPRNPEGSQTRPPEWLVLGDLAIHLSHLRGVFICEGARFSLPGLVTPRGWASSRHPPLSLLPVCGRQETVALRVASPQDGLQHQAGQKGLLE